MSAPDKPAGIPNYGFVQTPVVHPQQPNFPMTVQWNANPMATGPNGYPGSPMWNVQPPASSIILPNGGQWNIQPAPPAYVTTPIVPQNPQLAAAHQIFLKGKPYALGIVLIVMSILQIGFAIALSFLVYPSVSFISGIYFWGPLFYIIAGSLSICGHKTPDICKIKGSLALNIISSICSMLGIILGIIDYSVIRCDEYYQYCSDEHGSAGFTVISFLLVMNLLVFCISVSVSVFGCRAVEKSPSTAAPQIMVIQNDVVLQVPPQAFPAASNQPPAYVVQGERK
ncbi:membrane-spanning 4-domains subfamily A member 8-like [Hyperolius riggenbachi]|uniref:membrane-spanning 4-domains subfamily A member 8-like n=1 Tax=Hyperolius riggenbachi TaxID=752182 RepID=UPI0035A2B30D